jgi:hypothetical protein
MPLLTVLDLGGNRLTGSISPAVTLLNSLEELDLSSNQLTGGYTSLPGENMCVYSHVYGVYTVMRYVRRVYGGSYTLLDIPIRSMSVLCV